MELKKYMNSLLPSFTKGRVREDINMSIDELKRFTMPLLIRADEVFGERDFKSEYVKLFNVMYKERRKLPPRKNFFNGLFTLNEQLLKNLEALTTLAEKNYAADILRDALTVTRVNILQYIETAHFIARYSGRIVSVALACEVNVSKNRNEFDDLLQGEIKWLTDNRNMFITAVENMSHKATDLEEKIGKMPDILVTEESADTLAVTQGVSVIDPFKFNLLPTWLNPIYHVRMGVAEYQSSRYRATEAERKMVEFRIMQLQQLGDGQVDPKLEQQIEYNTGRLQDLNKKLLDMESNYD